MLSGGALFPPVLAPACVATSVAATFVARYTLGGAAAAVPGVLYGLLVAGAFGMVVGALIAGLVSILPTPPQVPPPPFSTVVNNFRRPLRSAVTPRGRFRDALRWLEAAPGTGETNFFACGARDSEPMPYWPRAPLPLLLL